MLHLGLAANSRDMDEDAPFAIRWPRVCARLAGLIVLLPVLYVLSFGPVAYLLYARSSKIDQAINRLYQPVAIVADRTNNVGFFGLVSSYLQWWCASRWP